MKPHVEQRHPAWRYVAWVPNVLILAALAGLGYWGHHYHWTLPGASASGPNAGTPAAGSDANLASAQPGGRSPADGQPLANGPLPSISFPSADVAKSCGIEVGQAEVRSMDDYVTATGIVGYDQGHLAQLAVRVPGIVWRVERRLGDSVRRGDVLVIVDAHEVGRAKADLLEAAVLYHLKTQNLERLRSIQSSVPARQLREVEAEWELARVRRFNALQALVNLGFAIRLDEISKLSTDQLATHLHLLGLPASMLESIDHETTSANLIPLTAPFDGVITNCEVVRGEMVEPSRPQYVLADVTRMWINLDVRQEDAARLRLGAPVVFQCDGDLRPVASTLAWIGTEIDPRARTVKARVDVVNPPVDETQSGTAARRLLQVNAFGIARISVHSNPTAVVVPSDALHWQWEIGRQLLFVAQDDNRRFEPRVVRKGLVRDGYSEIVEGLAAGERVVTAGSRILSSELSERLQEKLGDNAEAVRSFGANP